MQDLINIDKPITTTREDCFGRAAFAKRIAGICGKYDGDSYVIGLYGKWGEGKSSLFTMIGESLHTDILQINFNPWVFKEEDELLLAFFKLLSQELGRKLHTVAENSANILAEYGESIGLLTAIPKAGGFFSIGKKATNILLSGKKLTSEKAKVRVKDFIIESNVKIVVFIDDIDRLDAREVGAVFKLVKLLADFPRTTYILSFDPSIVAKMLYPLYGGTEISAGYHFLEKVIQLPLTIPKAHEEDILSYLKKSVESIAKQNNFEEEISDEQITEIFADGIFALLNTPRRINRFANSFSFSIAMLKGEVNIMDLLILEVFKSTIPEYYNFIRDNKDVFMTEFFDPQIKNSQDNTKPALDLVNVVIKDFSEAVKQALINLTLHIFPRFVWTDPAEAKSSKIETHLLNRKICTRDYFDRYFTFNLQEVEISDNHFIKHYREANNFSREELSKQIVTDIQKYSLRKIAYKLSLYRDSIKSPNSEHLIRALGEVSNRFNQSNELAFADPFRVIVFAVDSMIRALPRAKVYDVALSTIEQATSLDFAADLTARLVMPESKEKSFTFFSGEEALKIKEILIKRFAEKAGEMGFFKAASEDKMSRQLVWWKEVDNNKLSQSVAHAILNDSQAPLKLLRIFTPTLHVSGNNGENRLIKADFQEDQYELLDRIIGAELIYEKLFTQYGDVSIPYNKRPALHDELDDSSIIGIFMTLHKLKTGRTGEGGRLRPDE